MGFRSRYDNIGYNPTQNQSEFGTPRSSPFGVALRFTPPMARVDYFPSYPYRGLIDYTGDQAIVAPQPESLPVRTFGYRGIAPVTLQPLIVTPYPYQFGAKKFRNRSL
jgi:hypothetical protein